MSASISSEVNSEPNDSILISPTTSKQNYILITAVPDSTNIQLRQYFNTTDNVQTYTRTTRVPDQNSYTNHRSKATYSTTPKTTIYNNRLTAEPLHSHKLLGQPTPLD